MVKSVVDRSGMRCCVLMRCEAKVRSSEPAIDDRASTRSIRAATHGVPVPGPARIRCWGIHETFLISFLDLDLRC